MERFDVRERMFPDGAPGVKQAPQARAPTVPPKEAAAASKVAAEAAARGAAKAAAEAAAASSPDTIAAAVSKASAEAAAAAAAAKAARAAAAVASAALQNPDAHVSPRDPQRTLKLLNLSNDVKATEAAAAAAEAAAKAAAASAAKAARAAAAAAPPAPPPPPPQVRLVTSSPSTPSTPSTPIYEPQQLHLGVAATLTPSRTHAPSLSPPSTSASSADINALWAALLAFVVVAVAAAVASAFVAVFRWARRRWRRVALSTKLQTAASWRLRQYLPPPSSSSSSAAAAAEGKGSKGRRGAVMDAVVCELAQVSPDEAAAFSASNVTPRAVAVLTTYLQDLAADLASLTTPAAATSASNSANGLQALETCKRLVQDWEDLLALPVATDAAEEDGVGLLSALATGAASASAKLTACARATLLQHRHNGKDKAAASEPQSWAFLRPALAELASAVAMAAAEHARLTALAFDASSDSSAAAAAAAGVKGAAALAEPLRNRKAALDALDGVWRRGDPQVAALQLSVAAAVRAAEAASIAQAAVTEAGDWLAARKARQAAAEASLKELLAQAAAGASASTQPALLGNGGVGDDATTAATPASTAAPRTAESMLSALHSAASTVAEADADAATPQTGLAPHLKKAAEELSKARAAIEAAVAADKTGAEVRSSAQQILAKPLPTLTDGSGSSNGGAPSSMPGAEGSYLAPPLLLAAPPPAGAPDDITFDDNNDGVEAELFSSRARPASRVLQSPETQKTRRAPQASIDGAAGLVAHAVHNNTFVNIALAAAAERKAEQKALQDKEAERTRQEDEAARLLAVVEASNAQMTASMTASVEAMTRTFAAMAAAGAERMRSDALARAREEAEARGEREAASVASAEAKRAAALRLIALRCLSASGYAFAAVSAVYFASTVGVALRITLSRAMPPACFADVVGAWRGAVAAAAEHVGAVAAATAAGGAASAGAASGAAAGAGAAGVLARAAAAAAAAAAATPTPPPVSSGFFSSMVGGSSLGSSLSSLNAALEGVAAVGRGLSALWNGLLVLMSVIPPGCGATYLGVIFVGVVAHKGLGMLGAWGVYAALASLLATVGWLMLQDAASRAAPAAVALGIQALVQLVIWLAARHLLAARCHAAVEALCSGPEHAAHQRDAAISSSSSSSLASPCLAHVLTARALVHQFNKAGWPAPGGMVAPPPPAPEAGALVTATPQKPTQQQQQQQQPAETMQLPSASPVAPSFPADLFDAATNLANAPPEASALDERPARPYYVLLALWPLASVAAGAAVAAITWSPTPGADVLAVGSRIAGLLQGHWV